MDEAFNTTSLNDVSTMYLGRMSTNTRETRGNADTHSSKAPSGICPAQHLNVTPSRMQRDKPFDPAASTFLPEYMRGRELKITSAPSITIVALGDEENAVTSSCHERGKTAADRRQHAQHLPTQRTRSVILHAAEGEGK